MSASGGLPDGLEARLAEEPAITATTVVRGDTLGLVATARADGDAVDELPEGWRFPVEVLAVDPASYAEVLAVPEVATLGPGEALLSASSAAVRRLEPAAVLRFEDGTELVVAGVLPDAQLGAGEVVVSTASTIAPTEPRYLLATQRDPSVPFDLAATARDLDLDADVLVTAHGGEVPVLRHAPDVMAPARLKRAFGEFAVTDGPGRWFQQGATWLRAAYAEREVPIIGKLECHEAMFEPLTAALQELVDRGLDDLVDPADSTGCWAPRVQRGTTPSSHAWGVALDVNVQGNHQGAEPTMPPEVVEAFTRHGFVWGGTWPVPDGMHFELVVDRPPGEAWMPQPDDAG
ncbi:MAG: M15 family metallopeptidase [Nitriliruptoraceae bacterium]